MALRCLATLLLLSSITAVATAFNARTLLFEEGYSPLFGGDNVVLSQDGRSVSLLLNQYTGSGFISSDYYNHGFFSASIKLPADYTAGVVIAFYTSNGDVFEKTHDELDFEFLGNTKGEKWRVQTNVYGNGSTAHGREERYVMPFDPTANAHRYSILWTSQTIIFYIDEVPIREVVRSDAMGAEFPSKPMSLYATIWDGSTWATENGKYKIDYNYAPFTSDFSDLVLQGCPMAPLEEPSEANSERCAEAEAKLLSADYVMTPKKRAAMRRFREWYMLYSFCYDIQRYPIMFPDCNTIPTEQVRFMENGVTKFGGRPRRTAKRRSRASRANTSPLKQSDI